jgi:hypothetical protein
MLNGELGSMYVGVLGFYTAYFGEVTDLETAAKVVYEKRQEGGSPLCSGKEAGGVPLQGSTAERKLDVSFVVDPNAGKDSKCMDR